MRRIVHGRVAVVTALLLPLTVLPAPASAGTDFTFFGSGFGHGLGMGQYSALGLALKGRAYKRILRSSYPGTSVGPAPSVPRRIRVGLVQGRQRVQLAARNGRVELRVGHPATGTLVGRIPSGATWSVEPTAGGRYRVRNAAGRRVGGRLWGGPSQHLFARYANTGARVFVPEAGHTYNRGAIELNTYRTCPDCAYVLRLILPLAPRGYLFGIGEVPSSWPFAALKAQGVASLTYALEKVARVGLQPGCNCHLFATVLDQAYIGWDKEGGEQGERWVRAVREIGREVVLFGGQPIQAFFHSSNGGYAADNRDVFGAHLPYLEARCDVGDFTPSNPSNAWTVVRSAAEVTTALNPYTGSIGQVTGFTSVVRDVSGRMTSVTVQGTGGSATLAGATLRAALRTGLRLRSTRVWVNANRHVTGAIRSKYDGLRCAPGLPTSARMVLAGGARQRFQLGRIYHKPGVGAHWLHGPVLAYFLDQGDAGGRLGFPTSDVVTRPNGATRATFEGGRVVCTAGGACSDS